MAVDTNGTPKSPKAELASMNGHPNGSIHASGSRASRSRRKSKQTTYSGWVVDKAAKGLVWYTLITLLLRCPSSSTDLNDASPQICKPYLHARDYVAPYAQPYYDQYLSPYVQRAQPYYAQFNEKVYKPGHAAYKQHGAPRVAQAQKISQQQWEKTLKPQLDTLQKQTGKQYDSLLAPHVKKVQGVVQPYYDSLATSAGDIWELELEPVYRKTYPYAQKVYVQGQEFAVNTALPQAQYAGNTVWTFWTRQIWPKMRILYGENVEPQLLRITERLGRYKDGKKLEAEIKSMETSSKLADASVSLESSASSLSSAASQATANPSSVVQSATSTSSEPTIDPKKLFREDLKSWEKISAKAVEEGSEDLQERVKEITDRQIHTSEGVGNALVTQLEQTVTGAVNSVQAHILKLVRDLGDDADDERVETANDDLVLAIRAAGQNVKQRAQAIRDWRQTTQSDTEDLVDKAIQSTVETVDGIRELRLTEIGRKYASSSLPHKEWSKYNDLKKNTQAWRNDVEKAAHSHPGISSAKAATEDIEHQGMAIAEDAAKELARLKSVGKWKIAANADDDDFSTKHVPPPLRKAKDQIVEKIADAYQAVLGEEEQGTVESMTSVAAEKASQVAFGASEAVLGSSTGSVESAASKVSKKIVGSEQPVVDSVTSDAVKLAESIATAASEAVIGTESGISDSATDAASKISSAVLGTESGLSDSATDVASSISSSLSQVADKPLSKSVGTKLSSMLAAQKSNAESATKSVSSGLSEASKSASSYVAGAPEPVASQASASISSAASVASSKASSVASSVSSILPDAEEIADAADSTASEATASAKKVFAGANAQVLVEAREPILDDDIVDVEGTYSAKLQSMVNAGLNQAEALTQAVQDAVQQALQGATSTQGSVESATSMASAQYESAMSAASSVLFGTQKGAVESGTSAAQKQYLSAVTAASYAIYGTPATAAPVAAASSAYDNAISEAAKHYNAVKSRLSEQVSGTPEPIHQQMFSSAASAYSGAVSAADARLRSAGLGSATQNAYESISSVASSRLSEAVDAASSQYKSAKIAVGVEPTPIHQQYLASAQKAYYEALGVAHGRYSEFVEAASSVVAPTPTSTSYQQQFESAISDARSAYSQNLAHAGYSYTSALSWASSVAAAQSSTVGDAVLGPLEEQMADMSSIASSKFAQASKVASEAIYGKEPPFTESVASRASENWEALVSKASEQVYGAPVPFTESIASQATAFASQATDAAVAQWEAVNSLFGELVNGKEPEFTESVYSRLQSAYSTGAPALVSQASSYASDAYESASSIVSAVFVPPTQVPGIVEQMQSQLNAAVEAASVQAYGTTKGTVEQATEAAQSMYSDAASQVSNAVYGQETNYVEAAQSNILDIGSAASAAVSNAIYGSSTGSVEAASSAASSVYSSIASQAEKQASSASAAVSSAIYGEEQTYLEGVQSQLSVAMASANSRLAEFGTAASSAGVAAASSLSSVASDASKAAEGAASVVSDTVSSATERVRDEL